MREAEILEKFDSQLQSEHSVSAHVRSLIRRSVVGAREESLDQEGHLEAAHFGADEEG